VMMTAHGSEHLRDTSARLGVFGYLDKPFRMSQLRTLVEQAMEPTPYYRAAETLISVLRAEGRDWPATEAQLIGSVETLLSSLDETDRQLTRCVEVIETMLTDSGEILG
jgi:DNA-binding NtrC family response regulator